MKLARYLVLLSAALLSSTGFAQEPTATDAKITAAMAADIRTPEEVERDSNRLPLQTCSFLACAMTWSLWNCCPVAAGTARSWHR